MAGLSVNVFIVGINQISDVEIDRVNKPFLPIAAGELSRERAWWIVGASALLPIVLALTQGTLELAAVVAALAVGVAYSLPPARLKRFPVVASLCVSGVRSAIVNLGVAAHFTSALGGEVTIPDAVWALTVFVLPFSLAIAILKDVPDAEGDRLGRIATFTVRYGPRAVMRAGRRGAHARLPRDGGARTPCSSTTPIRSCWPAATWRRSPSCWPSPVA